MRSTRIPSLVLLSVAVLAAPLLPPVGVLAQAAPSVVVDPTTVQAGGVLSVDGAGFAGDCGVTLHVDDATSPSIGFATIDELGGFGTEVSIPATTGPGEHVLVAVGLEFDVEFCGGPSGLRAVALFEVLEAPYDRTIYLHARLLEDPGVDDELLKLLSVSGDPMHGIVQLNALPATGDLARLEELGILPLAYLNGVAAAGTAYLAVLTPPLATDSPVFGGLVRALQPLLPEDKRSLQLPPPGPGDPQRVLVTFFPDVSAPRGRAILSELGVAAEPQGAGLWVAEATPIEIQQLAETDEVQWIEPVTDYQPTLDVSRQLLNVDPVQQLDPTTGVYAGRTGLGVQIGIMDTGVDSSHNDFTGRLVRVQDDVVDHGTHVAGIAGGSGVQSDQLNGTGVSNGSIPFRWRGVAPRAGIAAYGQIGSNTALYADAINNFGVDVSNHSYVQQVQGLYNADARTVDRVVRGDSSGIPARPLVWTSANNASVGPRDCDGDGIDDGNFPQYPFPAVPPGGPCPTAFQAGYFSLLAACKNCLTVGSIDANQLHSGFSSMGPSHDGRLKPEVMALGNSVVSVRSDRDGNENPDFTNGYKALSGTSMAAPAVTGVIALMLEQYAATFGVNLDTAPPLPSTSKAILVQTAQDLAGTDPTTNFDTGAPVTYGAGPDWATGYGLVDAAAAVQMVADRQFLEDTVDDAGDHTDQWFVPVAPGQTELRVTLAWDDREGTPNASAAAPMLVNDLDLTVTDPNGVIHRPLVLPVLAPRDCDGNAANGVQVGTCVGQDPAGQNYFGPAAEGIDRRNNVEQVVVADGSGLLAGNWVVEVSVRNPDGTLRLPLGGDQPYSLAGVTTNQPPSAEAGGPYSTVEGTDVTLVGSGSDPEFGSLTFEWDFDSDGFDDAAGSTVTFDRVGQDGVFTVLLRVTDPGGLIAVDSATVTVANLPPTIDALGTDSPQPEASAVTLQISASDPGWLDPLTTSVDWGDGTSPATLPGLVENVRPDATFTATVSHVYGDNGTFTVEVCVSDDDSTTCGTTFATIYNVAPSLTLDTSGAVSFPGGPAFLGSAGSEQSHTAGGTDPGSDDLTFAWSFGTVTTYFNDGVGPDPLPSPLGTYPFSAIDSPSVTYASPGVYVMGVVLTDDDGGSATASLPKVVVGNEEETHPFGWWKHEYRGTGTTNVEGALLEAYLDIIDLTSSVFSEQTGLATIDDAVAVFEASGSDMRAVATGRLLWAWLHFASGAVEWTDPVPVGGGTTRPYDEVIAEIESIVLDPGAGQRDLVRASQLAERTFLAG